jgi:hypothetical protein
MLKNLVNIDENFERVYIQTHTHTHTHTHTPLRPELIGEEKKIIKHLSRYINLTQGELIIMPKYCIKID